MPLKKQGAEACPNVSWVLCVNSIRWEPRPFNRAISVLCSLAWSGYVFVVSKRWSVIVTTLGMEDITILLMAWVSTELNGSVTLYLVHRLRIASISGVPWWPESWKSWRCHAISSAVWSSCSSLLLLMTSPSSTWSSTTVCYTASCASLHITRSDF